MRKGNFEAGGKGRPIVKYKDYVVSCAKTAEPINMPFWMLSGPVRKTMGKQICRMLQPFQRYKGRPKT